MAHLSSQIPLFEWLSSFRLCVENGLLYYIQKTKKASRFCVLNQGVKQAALFLDLKFYYSKTWGGEA